MGDIVPLDIVRPDNAWSAKSAYNVSMANFGEALRDLFVPASEQERKEVREARPFFLIVIVMLVAIYGYAVLSTPALQRPGRLLVFSGLMLIHAVLHWNAPVLAHRPRAVVPYMMVQGVLAFIIVSIIGEPMIALILFGMMIGETVGVVGAAGDRRKLAVAVVFQASLAAISFISLSGWEDLTFQGLLILAITGFIVLYVVMFGRQAEARTRSETLLQELEIAHEQLAEYATQVEELTRTAERERMARELHDTLAQGLAGLILQLEAADAHLSAERPERAQEIVRQAMARARTTLSDSRRVIDDLRTDQSDSTGLADEVKKEAGRFTDSTGIPCAVELDSLDDVPVEVDEHARRIIAEALTNIGQHAQADQATIKVTSEDNCLMIEITDDGVGFDPATIGAESGHYGLIGLRERANLVGGDMTIEGVPGRGTRLSVQLPYHPVTAYRTDDALAVDDGEPVA